MEEVETAFSGRAPSGPSSWPRGPGRLFRKSRNWRTSGRTNGSVMLRRCE